MHSRLIVTKSINVHRALLVGDLPTPAIQAPVVDAPEVSITDIKLSEPPAYTKGQSIATREAYGTALVSRNKLDAASSLRVWIV